MTYINCEQCGKPTKQRPATTRQGPSRFCSIKCWGESQHVSHTRIYTDDHGYRMIKVGRRMLKIHRLIMEHALGRTLERDEVVHHRNGIVSDNRIANLEVMTLAAHGRMHGQIATWAKKHDHCVICGTTAKPHKAQGKCTSCYDTRDWKTRQARKAAKTAA